MSTLFTRFLRDDSGQDVIEYGLLAAFISVVAIATILAVGVDVQSMFTIVDEALVPGA